MSVTKASLTQIKKLDTLARTIASRCDAAEKLAKLAVDKCNEAVAEAILAGHALNEAKTIVGHGEWLPWLKEHCTRVKERTARKYMALANRHHDADLTGASLRQAYITVGIIRDRPKQPAEPTVVTGDGVPVVELPAPSDAMMLLELAIDNFKRIHPKDQDRDRALEGMIEWCQQELAKRQMAEAA